MPKPTDNLLTVIDLGSAKTVALTAEITEGGGLRYRAHGECESRGTRRGAIIELEKAAKSVQVAVQQVEDAIGAPIERAVVGIGGQHVRGVNSQGGITLGSRPREITREDLRQSVERARAIALPADRQVVHLLPQQFIIDGRESVQEPVGMVGTKLEALVHIVTAAVAPTQNVVTVVNRAGINVDDIAFEPLAIGDAVLRSDERELGIALVDVGAGSTDIAVWYEGAVYHTGAVPVGGDHFTNDTAVGLRTPLEEAEKIKRMFGNAVVTSIPDSNEIEVPSIGDRPSRLMRQRDLGEILEPRARELFELVRDNLQQAGVLDICGAGLVLTGGGSRMGGLLDVVDQVLRKPARVAPPTALAKLPVQLVDTEYATAIGLLLYAYRSREKRAREQSDSPLAKLKTLFAMRGF